MLNCMSQNVNIYPEKNNDLIVRWVVDYVNTDGNPAQHFCESEDKAIKFKDQLKPEKELDELVDEDGGLLDGDMPSSVGTQPSSQITSKSTTDNAVKSTRQGVSRWFSYRRFYGEAVEDDLNKPIENTKVKNSTIVGGDVQLLNRPSEIQEVDKTAEALGGIYSQSTDPIDFENKATAAGYDKDEITYRQEKFFRKTSDDQQKTNNPKIPLEEVEIVEDVLTKKTMSQGDFVKKTMDDQTSDKYQIPYYNQLKHNNPLVARKLIYLIDTVKREQNNPKEKASIIWQFLKGVDISDLRPEDKQYIIKFLQDGK